MNVEKSFSKEEIPLHLKKYVVDQNYQHYTPEDHAVWRFILKHLSHFLSQNAHPCYMEGLKKTGITLDRIPKIEEIDKKLQDFGWRAIPVSGFIPPAAFMEFQSRGFLPIASDMRTLEHILYTPAPDIVHEAAGHAPILIEPDFSHYLSQYAQVANKAIISHEDLKQYELIRKLSDLKESPDSTTEEIQNVEKELLELNAQMKTTSEAGLLSRMNWWTAEYGLIGDIKNPKIFGAGLLSSLGESRSCLKEHVKKIPLSLECINFSYDITEKQPQLFVTPTFEHLTLTLQELSQKMAFYLGGEMGLEKALQAKTVNTVELNSGLQISGVLSDYLKHEGNIIYLKFSGPTQLSIHRKELAGHDKDYHSHGYSTPLGPIKKLNKCLSQASKTELKDLGIIEGNQTTINYKSGIVVTGHVKNLEFLNDRLIICSLEKATVTWGDQILFAPEWGTFDLGVGSQIPSVFGGAADSLKYGELSDDFVAKRVPTRNYSAEELNKHSLYKIIESLKVSDQIERDVQKILSDENTKSLNWLMYEEVLSIVETHKLDKKYKSEILNRLKGFHLNESESECLGYSLT